jgi:short-subunit dehydrogenase
LATAELLNEKGYRVYATAPNTDPRVDVTDAMSIQTTVEKIIATEGRIDVLINNAGYGVLSPIECQTMDEIQSQMDVNFFGVIRMCQAVLPQMRKQQSGQIINISSIQGCYGLPYGSLYSASKAALESFSEALSIELLPWNIHVSIVEPGMVATGFAPQTGSRKVENDPYAKINQRLADSLKKPRIPSDTCQTPEAVAQVLYSIIEDPAPQLRYQTSEGATENVSRFIKDLTGQEYIRWMKPQIDDYYQTYTVSDSKIGVSQ